MDSKAYAHGNGHVHGIIHDYLSKFGRTTCVIIVDNVSIGICNYLVIKNKFFIFQVLEITFSVKEVPQIVLKFVPFHFSPKVG